MNWMLIIVILIFLIFIFRGWRRGFLKTLFPLIAIVVLIPLISWINPYISTFLKDHTGLYARIEARSAESMETRLSSGWSLFSSSTDSTADWILKGMSYVISLIVVLIILLIIFRLLGLVNKVPVVKGFNRVLGLFSGAFMGYLIICVLFLVISLIAGTEIGSSLMENIDSNAFLSFLNNNNILFNLNLIR